MKPIKGISGITIVDDPCVPEGTYRMISGHEMKQVFKKLGLQATIEVSHDGRITATVIKPKGTTPCSQGEL